MIEAIGRRAALGALAVASTGLALPAWAAAEPSASAPLRQSRANRALTINSPALLERDAKAAMPEGAFDFVHGAAGDEWTLHQNGDRLRALMLRPHRLAGFSKADTPR